MRVYFDMVIIAKVGENVLSITKVQQARIFKIEKAMDKQPEHISQTKSLNTLYPYATQQKQPIYPCGVYISSVHDAHYGILLYIQAVKRARKTRNKKQQETDFLYGIIDF